MTRRLTAVLSQGLSHHPEKIALEQNLLAGLRDESRLTVVVVPNLYDLRTDGPAASALRQIDGDIIVLSWMYSRGSHWILDFHGIDGQVGKTDLANSSDQANDPDPADDHDQKERVMASRPPRQRNIYCLDLRARDSAAPYLDEIRRIVDLADSGQPADAAVAPDDDTRDQGGQTIVAQSESDAGFRSGEVMKIDDPVGRRWYPVIDFSRCTNCMECVDFCLFGVYGVDDAETILVELPDNCRKGCPACSRVCPEKAIIFPQHKTPIIAGAAIDGGSMKIDLSKLFGAPSDVSESAGLAQQERNEQLQQAGRGPTGAGATVPAGNRKKTAAHSRDELDDLMDELDNVDL